VANAPSRKYFSDASAELSAPELEFLRRAIELCPSVLFAQTKTDLFANWQKILDLNRGHLERNGINIPVVPVSSSLRTEALARKDRSLRTRTNAGWRYDTPGPHQICVKVIDVFGVDTTAVITVEG